MCLICTNYSNVEIKNEKDIYLLISIITQINNEKEVFNLNKSFVFNIITIIVNALNLTLLLNHIDKNLYIEKFKSQFYE